VRAESGGWTIVEAAEGQIALVLDAGELVVRHDADWVALGARLGVAQALTRLGIGTTADASNPFAARLNTALWTALDAASGGTGDLRLTLNKETTGDILSLIFQSGYGGRAELGLVGDDDLRLKVSDNGEVWHEAFAVERATGRATFARGAVRRSVTVFETDGSYVVPPWARSVEAVTVGGGGGGGAGADGASGSRFGGGGGGAGGISRGEWPAGLLGGTLTVVVGAGGAGGSATTAPNGPLSHDCVRASHHANGAPIRSSRKVTIVASLSVSQIAAKSSDVGMRDLPPSGGGKVKTGGGLSASACSI
jgi:hypothetical protein